MKNNQIKHMNKKIRRSTRQLLFKFWKISYYVACLRWGKKDHPLNLGGGGNRGTSQAKIGGTDGRQRVTRILIGPC